MSPLGADELPRGDGMTFEPVFADLAGRGHSQLAHRGGRRPDARRDDIGKLGPKRSTHPML